MTKNKICKEERKVRNIKLKLGCLVCFYDAENIFSQLIPAESTANRVHQVAHI